MTEKEKQIQRALGTLPTFSVKIKVSLEAANRSEALKKSREMVKSLQQAFPECTFSKYAMKSLN